LYHDVVVDVVVVDDDDDDDDVYDNLPIHLTTYSTLSLIHVKVYH
jgi:hypothetical protein